MNARDVIATTLDNSMEVLSRYVGDLSDQEMLMRPGKDCNHIAWQLGHLIASEYALLESVAPGAGAKLPPGFDQQHSKETAGSTDPNQFCSKETYLKLYRESNQATKAALAKLTDADLDKPGPEQFRSMFPTVGSIFILIATHPLMHAGQFVPLRRELGKPIVI